MLSCQEITEIVTKYVEGRLTFGEWLRFQLHLGMCRHCRRYVRQMRLTLLTLGALPAAPPPDDVRDVLFRRFANWRR